MTGMLASVRDAGEARLALRARVEVIDIKDPLAGALGALDPGATRAIVQQVDGRGTVSATTGDLPCRPRVLETAIRRTWSTGVDIVKVGVFAEVLDRPVLAMLGRISSEGARIVLVFFAEQWHGRQALPILREAGVSGVMLDTRDKESGPLTTKLPCAVLGRFVADARAAGLMSGLAGSLAAADVPVLAPLAPDYLGFRGALCRDGRRGAAMDGASLFRIRRLLAGYAATPAVI